MEIQLCVLGFKAVGFALQRHKGANILVGPTGQVKLADFGMAKHVCYLILGMMGLILEY